MSDEQVMQMPISRFWLLLKSIDRILAEQEIVMARASSISQAQDSKRVEEYYNSLKLRKGGEPIVVVDDSRDESGINFLKKMSNKPAM